jgi:CHAD domain-containing protein
LAPRLKPKKPGARGVERALEREVKKALESLDGGRPISEESVHSARKRLKRARAELRLMRPALGDRVYRRENRALRDAARPLSEARDAKVMVETFQALGLDHGVNTRRFRAVLAQQRRDATHKIQNPKRVAAVLGDLRSVHRRVSRARPRRHGWSVMGPGLRRTYRAGRRAYAAARLRRTPALLHEWRKQTKYWWHIVQILEPIWPEALRRIGRQAHRLSDQLGEDHDLVMLRESAARSADPATRQAALDGIDRRRQALQNRAMALGAIVFKERPRTLERRLHRRWRAWRSNQPKDDRS